MNENQAIPALSALAHLQRLRVFRALVGAGPDGLTPSVLADQLQVARNTMSFHLKELTHADLVSVEQQGRNLIYRARFEQMNSLISYLTAHCCQGGNCELVRPGAACAPVSQSQSYPEAFMENKVYNVLFICTGNSARSILAEGLLNGLGNGRFHAYSAGSHPKGEVHPLALATLERLSMPATGYRSKSWDEFAQPGAPKLDFVFTVCDNAAGEVCPIWPGQPMTAHWGAPDPAAVEGTDEAKRKAFHDAAITMKRRIELFLSLPIRRLDAMSLQKELRGIGQA